MTPAAPQVAVGAVCLHDGRLLLVRRGRGVAVDRWSLPGGRLESGERLSDAVLRELAEETGLRGRVTGLCGVAERLLEGHHFVILDYWVDLADDPPAAAVAGDDAAAVTWAGRADLERLPLVPRLGEFLDEFGVLTRLRP